MTTIYLHIGAPKTATSTLQNVLAKNAKRLLKHGVLYPGDMRDGDAHHLLVCDLIEKYEGKPMPDVWYGEQPRGQAWESLRQEIKRHENNIDSVILSSELFFGQNRNLEPMLEEISGHLQGHEIRVVVYLRRQDELYSSFFNQDVKGLRQWPASAYEFYETHQMLERDYHSLLRVWSGAFGKKHVIIRPFESEQWLNGDIVQDFCASIDTIPLRSGFKDHNESLGVNQLYFKRCLNRIGFDKSDNADVLKIITSIAKEEPAKGCLYVNRRLYQKYRVQWLQVNEALSEDYLQGQTLFQHPIPEPHELDRYVVDVYKIAGIIQKVYKVFKSGKYPEYRSLFIRATLLMLAEKNLWHCLDAKSQANMLEWV